MAKWSQTKSHPNYGQAEAVVLHKAEELNAAGVRCVSMTVVGKELGLSREIVRLVANKHGLFPRRGSAFVLRKPRQRCQICDLPTRRPQGRTHRECHATLLLSCPVCGKEFLRRRSSIIKQKAFFCSSACCYQGRRTRMHPETSMKCSNCGDAFVLDAFQRHGYYRKGQQRFACSKIACKKAVRGNPSKQT